MLAVPEISVNLLYLAAMILLSGSIGFLINRAQVKKQQSAISKLEVEMLRCHSEILQLQKELSNKEELQSKTPIFSIHDTSVETDEKLAASARLSKKIAGGGGKSSS